MDSNILFIEDDNNVEQPVDTLTTPPPTKASAKKLVTKRQKLENGQAVPGPGASSRDPNWNEEDSIRLIKAFQYSEEKRKGKPTLR
jgi:hypothetical protein